MDWKEHIYVDTKYTMTQPWGAQKYYHVYWRHNDKLVFHGGFKYKKEAEAHAAAWFRQHNKEIEKILLD